MQNTIIPISVTSIGEDSFSGFKGLTTVTIPSSVTFIGQQAFFNCSGLTSIVSLNSNPPSVQYANVFYKVDENNCIVWVPKGSQSAYKEAYVWKDFANIKEIADGDVNLDEKVNRKDINELVAHIMGNPSVSFNYALADVNKDGFINVADIVTLLDLLSHKVSE